MRIAVVLPAGGSGSRFGGRRPKQFQLLCGRPVIEWTIRFFRRCPEVAEIVLVVPQPQLQAAQRLWARNHCRPLLQVVAGGDTRQASVLNGLLSIRSRCRWVAIHDAVRPLLSRPLWLSLLQAARQHGAALPGIAVTNTLKRIDDRGRILETVPRESLVQVQTPQVFQRELLLQASRRAEAEGFLGTDEAMLVERLGKPVQVVHGSSRNIKITVPGDRLLAAWILKHPSWEKD